MSTELKPFDELQSQIMIFVSPVKEIKVIDKDTSAQASKVFRDLNDWEKQVEAKRKELVGPLNDQVKRINEYAKQIVAPLTGAKAHVSEELIKFERILEAERQDAIRLEREEARKREEEARAKIELQRKEAEAKIAQMKEDAEALAMFAPQEEAEEATTKANEDAEKLKSGVEAEAARVAFETKQEHWDAKKEIAQHKVTGTRRTWTFKVIDLNLVPDEFKIVSLDEKKVKKMIALEVREIHGLEIFQELSITAR